ncbi:hypothetical protein GGQ54_000424 [Naumannella cuiyingiana]|uniref:Uncharacterized protein n=1 Tax=Naumannella cuiyingiana TaxID=1347891 RepID=A0A7Z0D6R1_9ACTN|nr:hypothetical protein [Naumannella cuiyingiana]NYI69864.1 hypothetical protein [Naumannella cuiyingiana]
MQSAAGAWDAILADAHRYPSPHNSQPITLALTGPHSAIAYYDKRRGLPAEDFGVPFGFVCMGVFLAHLEVAAAGHGYAVESELELAEMDFADPRRQHPFARLRLVRRPADERARDGLRQLRRRRTSRRPYDSTPVPPAVIAEVTELAARHGYRFRTSAERAVVDKIIEVNAETLFDDLRRDAVYRELMDWLRFSRREAAATGDGLSAETLLMPGPALRLAFRNRWLWQAPVIGPAIRHLYLRTMTGVAQVGWLEGPFATLADYVGAGRCFLEVWLALTAHGIWLHPYGTVITNPTSHRRFAELVGAREDDGEMAWMLFRLGRSATPPRSHRRPVASMIIEEQS